MALLFEYERGLDYWGENKQCVIGITFDKGPRIHLVYGTVSSISSPALSPPPHLFAQDDENKML